MAELVSVVMPTFNAAPYLRQALDSVLAQASRELELEVIVVDDESTDETPEIARTYGERIRFLQIPHCGKPGVVRNCGLRAARADYVAFLDADDVCLPGRIQRQLALIKSTGSDLAVGDCLEFSGENPPKSSFLERIGAKARLKASLRDSVVVNAFEVMLEIGGFIPPSAAMARRKTLLDLGLFPEHLQCGEDLELFLRLALRGRIALDLAPLTLRRLHSNNISRDRWRTVSDGLLICRDLEKLDVVARQPRLANLVRRRKASWYREMGSLYLRKDEPLEARKSWAEGFRLAPSFRLGLYWMLSFMPSPWLKASLALKQRMA
jgi:glycosyltransferase involved in cell wall biosynthesis